MKLSLIIPAYNEEKFLQRLLEKLISVPFAEHGYTTEILIINDGSKDRTGEIARTFQTAHPEFDIKYYEDVNHGKGYAVKQGFRHATGEVMVIQDADLEYDPFDLLEGIERLQQKNLEVIYGSRIRGFTRYGFTYSTIPFLVGGLLVSACASIAAGRLITDEPTCYKMFTKACKPFLLSPPEDGFEREPAATIAVLRAGFRYGERPIRYFPRKVTAGKKIKFNDGLKALRTIWKRMRKKVPKK